MEHYPETCDPKTDSELLYCGPHMLQDTLPESSLGVGEALLSPTRTYLPLAKAIFEECGNSIKGFVHCSGGGQTKCMRFGTKVHHIKDNLFKPPPLFREIQRASKTTDHEMHQVYNMGHRFEAFCDPDVADNLIQISREFEIDAQIIGRTEPSTKLDETNHLTISLPESTLTYE